MRCCRFVVGIRRRPFFSTTSTVVTLALMWFGVRNLEQTSFLEKQQAREQLESGATHLPPE